MCCIFTCCTWMVDLVQRCWTFTMSCLIGLAISCVMISTSMAGIALGYNYSMAEFIDLKETNISVYVKRGVFDDEIADDFHFRRAGQMPVGDHLASDNLMTASPDATEPIQSGRRLDDSIVESDDPNKYEGSLMKLTARAPYPAASTMKFDDGNAYKELGKTFAPGSLDDLKSLHYVINARKAAHPVNALPVKQATLSNTDDRFMAHFRNAINSARRMDPTLVNVNQLNPARFAVPDKDLKYPKDPERFLMTTPLIDDRNPAITIPIRDRYASPIPVEPPPRRPSVWPTFGYPKTVPTPTRVATAKVNLPAEPDKSLEAFKEKLLMDTIDESAGIEKQSEGGGPRMPEGDEYEEEIKGLPVRRRRRSIQHSPDIIIFEEPLKENLNNNIHLNSRTHDNDSVLTNKTTDVGNLTFSNVSNGEEGIIEESNITTVISATKKYSTGMLSKLTDSTNNNGLVVKNKTNATFATQPKIRNILVTTSSFYK